MDMQIAARIRPAATNTRAMMRGYLLSLMSPLRLKTGFLYAAN
jgi:hypothetical protein